MVTSGPKDKKKKRDMFGGFSEPIPAHVKKFLIKNFFATEKAYQKALDKQFGVKTKSDNNSGRGGSTKPPRDRKKSIKESTKERNYKHGGKAKKRKY